MNINSAIPVSCVNTILFLLAVQRLQWESQSTNLHWDLIQMKIELVISMNY